MAVVNDGMTSPFSRVTILDIAYRYCTLAIFVQSKEGHGKWEGGAIRAFIVGAVVTSLTTFI